MSAIVFVVGITLIGLAVAAIVRGLSLPSHRGNDVIDQIGSYGFSGTVDETDGRRTLGDFATSVGDAMSRRRSKPADESPLRARLISAGWYSLSPKTFHGYQAIGLVSILVIWIVMGKLGGVATPIYIVGMSFAALFGWYLPSIVLNRKVEERQAQINRALPELIDLLVVAVETGMGLVQALRLTMRELDGPLAQELRLTLQEQTMGLSTAEALESMSKRVNTAPARSFSRAITQGERLGISLAQILRNLADEMRKRRKAMAEERAQKAPVKMLFPLVLLIFPGMFVVLLLPAIISIANTLGG